MCTDLHSIEILKMKLQKIKLKKTHVFEHLMISSNFRFLKKKEKTFLKSSLSNREIIQIAILIAYRVNLKTLIVEHHPTSVNRG